MLKILGLFPALSLAEHTPLNISSIHPYGTPSKPRSSIFNMFTPYVTHLYPIWVHLRNFTHAGPLFTPYELQHPIRYHKKPRCEISAQMRQVITIWAPYTVVWRASFWHGVESVIRIGLYACNYSVSLRPTFD